jgi:hypothetical protein
MVGLLGCYTVHFEKCVQKFQRNILTPVSELKIRNVTFWLMMSSLVDGSQALVSKYSLHLHDRLLLAILWSSGLKHDVVFHLLL